MSVSGNFGVEIALIRNFVDGQRSTHKEPPVPYTLNVAHENGDLGPRNVYPWDISD